MKDRRSEIRPATRLQLHSIAGGLTSASAEELLAALTLLYGQSPQRWQRFMDEAATLIDTVGTDDSGFAETVARGDS